MIWINIFFFFSSRRRHTRSLRDWSSDVCSSDLAVGERAGAKVGERLRDTESDDEGENRRARDQMEILLTDQRQHTALEPNHGADERVQADEEAELRSVCAQPEPNVDHVRARGRHSRLTLSIRWVRLVVCGFRTMSRSSSRPNFDDG